LAEAMVDMDLVVYRVENTKTREKTFMSDREIEADEHPDQWKKIQPVLESQEGRFLEVNGTRAVELELAEGNASSRKQLQDRYKLRDDLLVLEPSGLDTAVYILNLPIVTGLLFVIGLVALYIEFTAPGIGLGGLTAGLCFALFFWSRFLGGTAGWLEVVLFVCGVAFLGVELFVLPGFGVAGLTGILLLLVSLVLAGQNFVVPNTGRQLATLTNTLLVVMGSGAVFAVAAYALSSYFGKIPILGRLTLEPPDPDAGTGPATPRAARTDSLRHFGVEIGDLGVADSPLRPAGKARFGDHYVDVVTDGLLVPKGTRVRVLKISGNRVVVRQVEDDT
jgi:membrane-bound serine protease (ClpP class)